MHYNINNYRLIPNDTGLSTRMPFHEFHKFIYYIITGLLVLLIAGCQKLVSIPPPLNTVTTSEVFGTDVQAASAIAGIYSNMIDDSQGDLLFGNGAMTIYGGLSSDELINYYGPSSSSDYQFNSNKLLSNNGSVYSYFWSQPYSLIYSANASIAGLAASTTIQDSTRNELTGEAKFIRAFCYFYLTNLFGNVPLALTTNFNETALVTRTAQTQVYQQIVADLKDAKKLLPTDYSVGLGERIRPNKWAAGALLARAYLFTGDWANAEAEADSVITYTSLYSLDALEAVFLKNSSEAIWQLQINSSLGSQANGTQEGNYFPLYGFFPFYYLSDQLLNSFESGDQRKSKWIDSVNFNGINYYLPYKYTVTNPDHVVGGPVPQYYMILRLAEQYLIKAEAEAQRGESSAIADLNVIRNRAGLPNYSGATDPTSLENAITHERQTELFMEWGHRWLDLKRNQLNTVLGSIPIKQPWSSNYLLFPIPLPELNKDPNLSQNSGY